MSSGTLQPEPTPIRACTISRDVTNFDLLIDDMEAILGESWGDLGFEEVLAFLDQPDAETLEFVAIALDDDDADDLANITAIITSARAKGIKSIIVAEDLSTATLHQLLRNGADEFIPYPLPENELAQVVERLRQPEPVAAAPTPQEHRPTLVATGDRDGVIFPVHGLAGGTGATTFAVNLAWELANIQTDKPPRVCLLDLDLQYGAAATYLDLPRRDSVLEMLQDTESMDNDVFMQALLAFNDRLHVMTAPSEIVPLDLVDQTDIGRILAAARANFDFVVVDMPKTLVQWTETVLLESHVYFAVMELDLRSAQNALRLKKALQAEDLPFEKLRFAINRSPGLMDVTGRSRIKRLSESLNLTINIQLPDGGKTIAQAGDHGVPLSDASPKNPLRKEILKLAESLFDLSHDDAEAA
ncbi:AAA family ATPase [Shimia ponticola]|uniref:AAA family ATPase n=1 Tax=Shimia ponticola TaxID=2582893 RepID=UPI0011BEE16E|nr:AAA family ATPase [Shimia ponticola]